MRAPTPSLLPTAILLAAAILLTGCVTPARDKQRRSHAAIEGITSPASATPATRAA